MRFLLTAVAAFACFTVSNAVLSEAGLRELVPYVPKCAEPCLTEALKGTNCTSVADGTCTCASLTYRTAAAECVFRSCKTKDVYMAQNITDIGCEAPIRNKSDKYRNINLSFFCLAVFAIIARTVAHFTVGRINWLEEGCMAMIFVLSTGLFTVIHIMSNSGLGHDMWKVPTNNIYKVLLYFWASEIIYFILLPFLKISFLLFYLNIFPNKLFRRITWGLIIFNLFHAFTFGFAAVFVCTPINYAWQQWDLEHKGKCINNNALAFAHAGFSITMDFITLSLPFTQIYGLQLAWRKKVGVVVMFSVGAFVTIVSILRLRSLVNFANTQNMTWDYLEASLWSLIETDVACICTCMPAIRLGLVRLFPKILGSTHQSTSRFGKKGKSTNNGTQPFSSTGIAVSTSLKVTHAKRPQVMDESSFVQLVEIEADAKSQDSKDEKDHRSS